MARVLAHRTAEICSMGMVSLVPLTLVFYRLIYASEPTLAAAICRPTLLAVCFALFALWCDTHIINPERNTFRVLGVLCGALLVTSAAAADPGRAIQEWVKLVAICSITFMLCRPLRERSVSRALGIAMVLSSIVLAGMIIWTYVRYMGFVIPTYPAIRVLKGTALDDDNIALNPLGFECVFTFLCGLCLIRANKFLWGTGALLLVISSVLTGSRAPLAVFLVSVIAMLLLNGLRSRSQLVRASAVLGTIGITAGAVLGIAIASPQTLSRLTEGRWDLWSVAFHKFEMHPLWGNGYLSVLDDPTFLPGGYHSEYLTALAEQGLIGFAAVIYVFVSLLRRCYDMALNSRSRHPNGQILLFACLFLMFRALVELPGLFGTAQGPADFLAYIFLAIAMTRTPAMEPRFVLSETRASPISLAILRPTARGEAVSGEQVY